MAVRQILGAVGAVVGFWLGGPAGAQYGWMIGSAIGSIADPQILRGPTLGDLAQQTSQEGIPRPMVFGMSPPMAGNIIASGQPKKKKTRKSQGKGGPKVETEHVLRTYAIGICEGPVTRLVRVWRNGELVYVNQGVDEMNFNNYAGLDILQIVLRVVSSNAKVRQRAKFYPGTFSQDPDPSLEEEFGVGNVPAHRGTAYIVVTNDDLTDQRGAIPQFMFQVERCEGYYLTTPPYPMNELVAMDTQGTLEREGPVLLDRQFQEGAGAPLGGDIFGSLGEYEDGEPEAVEGVGTPLGGSLFGSLGEYEEWPPEAIEGVGAPLGGELFEALVVYDDGEPEPQEGTGELLGGTLE